MAWKPKLKGPRFCMSMAPAQAIDIAMSLVDDDIDRSCCIDIIVMSGAAGAQSLQSGWAQQPPVNRSQCYQSSQLY